MPAPDPHRLRRCVAAAVVFDDHGRILLHRRADNGLWALPGGAIELDETAEQACVREVFEETGFEVHVVRLVGIYSDPRHATVRYSDGNVVQYVAVTFECRAVGGAAALNDEATAIEWFDPRDLPEPFFSNHVPRVQDALAKQTQAFYR